MKDLWQKGLNEGGRYNDKGENRQMLKITSGTEAENEGENCDRGDISNICDNYDICDMCDIYPIAAIYHIYDICMS